MEGTEEQVNELQEEITEVKEVMKAFAEDIGSLVAHCQQMNIAVAQFRKDQDTLIKANDSLSKRIKRGGKWIRKSLTKQSLKKVKKEIN